MTTHEIFEIILTCSSSFNALENFIWMNFGMHLKYVSFKIEFKMKTEFNQAYSESDHYIAYS